jgi:hypothetical protein
MKRTFCDWCEKELGTVVKIASFWNDDPIPSIDDEICTSCYSKLKNAIKEIKRSCRK